MPLFKCSICGCVENTALSGYWIAKRDRKPALCSYCDPDIGKWHDQFPRETPSVRGYKLGDDGFLYNAEWKPLSVTIVGDP